MLRPLDGSTQLFLVNVKRTQERLERSQIDISSGVRLHRPSDDPAAAGRAIAAESEVGGAIQTQKNLAVIKVDAEAADAALQSAIERVERAITMAAQGGSMSADATLRATLAEQVAGIHEAIVGLSGSAVNGRYIFSGDYDTQPPFAADAAAPDGVMALVPSSATRVALGPDGAPIALDRAAGEIFQAAGDANVFGGLHALQAALLDGSPDAIAAAAGALRVAHRHLNSQLAFYGELQVKVADAASRAAAAETRAEAALGDQRDTDVPRAAMEMTQAQVGLEASLSSRANILRGRNLFDFLG